jgi:hypothetical protein
MDNGMYNWKRKGFNINILPKDESSKLMKKAGISTLNIIKIESIDSMNEEMMKSGPFLVIAHPKNIDLNKEGEFNIDSMDKLNKFLKILKNPKNYDIFLIPQINGIKNGYVGVVINSLNTLFIEILFEDNITDVRKLTREGSNLLNIYSGKYIKNRLFAKPNTPIFVLEEFEKIKNIISPLEGYFEFVQGTVNGNEGIWFVDYQNDPKYLNIIKCFE